MITLAMFTTLAAASQALAGPTSTMPMDEEMRIERVAADYFSVPPGTDARLIAEQYLEEEGLRQWNDGPPILLERPEYSLMAITTGDGRNVRILFTSASSKSPPGICRVRALAANGVGPASYRASRWCAEKFGVELPETPAPPIVFGRNSNDS